MTEEELQELRDCVFDYARAYFEDGWQSTENEWKSIVDFVNAMLAKRK